MSIEKLCLKDKVLGFWRSKIAKRIKSFYTTFTNLYSPIPTGMLQNLLFIKSLMQWPPNGGPSSSQASFVRTAAKLWITKNNNVSGRGRTREPPPPLALPPNTATALTLKYEIYLFLLSPLSYSFRMVQLLNHCMRCVYSFHSYSHFLLTFGSFVAAIVFDFHYDRKEKRKVEMENKPFLPEWTDLYCFKFPIRVRAVWIICRKTLVNNCIKSYNIKRH